jgi:hypothetical protein
MGASRTGAASTASKDKNVPPPTPVAVAVATTNAAAESLNRPEQAEDGDVEPPPKREIIPIAVGRARRNHSQGGE